MASVTVVSSPSTFLISENTALQDSDSQVIYNDLCIICNDLWQDHIPNNDILTRTGVPSMYSHLSQRRLRWIGHVRRMEDGRIPKDGLYGKLASGSRRVGRPGGKIDTDTWEDATRPQTSSALPAAGTDCRSRIGLNSHTKCCSSATTVD